MVGNFRQQGTIKIRLYCKMAIRFTDEQVQHITNLALDGCQNGTIANITGIALTTLKRRFGKLLTKQRCQRKHNLRHNQTELGKTSADMAKFLGKVELGQEEKTTIVTETGHKQSEAEQKALKPAIKLFKEGMA